MSQQGGCLCGNVRYTVSGAPLMAALCHCTDCRKITGSSNSTNAIWPESAFKLTQGTPKEYGKKVDSGNILYIHFCGDCGSTLWSSGPVFAGVRVIKIGTLDDDDAMANLKPVAELYVGRRVPWVHEIEGAAQHEGMPPAQNKPNLP